MKIQLKKTIITLCLASALLSVSTLKASNFNFAVDINTSGLVSGPAAPYYLDFQLNGGPSPANTVTLSNFIFTGGAPLTGLSEGTNGTATGNLSTTITLDDSSTSLNEIWQAFSQQTSDIKFNVSLSQNGSGVTPDAFVVSLLDNTTTSYVTTTAANGTDLLSVNLSAANVNADIKSYSSISPSGVTAVPEPSTLGVLGIGAFFLFTTRRFRRC